MEKNFVVSKANYFISSSSYDLSLEEQRIILILASMVHPDDSNFKSYKFKISDFLDLLGLNSRKKYTTLPTITKELMKKVFEIKENNKLIQLAWLNYVEYDNLNGTILLEFSPRLRPYLLNLKGFFTSYRLANILRMKNKYSPRIYELLKMNAYHKKGFEIEVEQLRKLFKAEDTYKKYNDFKKYILIKTQEELKEHSDIKFKFEEIKQGRKVHIIKFFIFDNKKKIKEIKEIIPQPVPVENSIKPKQISIDMPKEELNDLDKFKNNLSNDVMKNQDIDIITRCDLGAKIGNLNSIEDVENLREELVKKGVIND